MQPDPTELLITILGQTFPYDTPSDGIAVSPDGQVKKRNIYYTLRLNLYKN